MTRAVLPSDPAWLCEAFKDLGLKEKPGRGSNPRVVKMYADADNAGVTDDAVAWCAAAVGAWLKRAGLRGTGKLTARSYLDWGKDVSDDIPRGAIVVFKRGSSEWQGHVAICLKDNGRTLTVLGGNQSDAVTIANYNKSSLLGARWPKHKSLLETVKSSRTIKTATAVAAGASTDAISSVTDTASQVAAIKGSADEIGVTDWLLQLASNPRFWMSAGIVIAVGFIIYWKWQKDR